MFRVVCVRNIICVIPTGGSLFPVVVASPPGEKDINHMLAI